MPVRYQNWRDDYQSRLKSPVQAVEVIKEGDLVSITIICPAAIIPRNEACRSCCTRKVELAKRGETNSVPKMIISTIML